MSKRERLPERRESETVEFWFNGLDYTGTASRFSDGRLAEVFLDTAKGGSAGLAARDAALAASLALQYGCSAAELRASLTRLEDGGPAGPLAVLLDLVEPSAKP